MKLVSLAIAYTVAVLAMAWSMHQGHLIPGFAAEVQREADALHWLREAAAAR